MTARLARAGICLAIFSALLPLPAQAGQRETPATPVSLYNEAGLPPTFDGPAPPMPPAVISRDTAGHATIRAVRIDTPLRIDGRLDEFIYTATRSISEFIQNEPHAGSPTTEKTELWLLFDGDNVYVAGRCWESQPDRIVVNEMRRDNGDVWQNDHLAFILDTFYDRRNSFEFAVTPIGARMDGQISNERQYNGDWNTVWDVAVGHFDGGWTFEAAIPFKSLRYRPGTAQVWGFNARRVNRWKGETSFVTATPAGRGAGAILQTSLAATVVALEAPSGSKNIEIKPYVIGDLTSDRTVTPKVSNDPGGDVGVDLKYGITQNLTADLTYNTDFAQVEADEQQINLTRFSLFFPEKREFFLENQGTFAFGGSSNTGSSTDDTPVLFYSRRIGLNTGRVVPIAGGGRVTGRLGRFDVGMLNIQSQKEDVSATPSTNFSVLRVRRDFLRRSAFGALFTRRAAGAGGSANETYGVDGTFSFFDNLNINTFWARTRTEGLGADDISYRAQLDYSGDRYGVQAERLVVGSHFNPEVGFIRRPDLHKTFGLFRFSPRPHTVKSIRKVSMSGSFARIENGAGRLDERDVDGVFSIEYDNGDKLNVNAGNTYEFVPQPFAIASNVTVPVGGYNYSNVVLGYSLSPKRKLSGSLSAEYGTFYNGHKTVVGFSKGRVNITPKISITPSISVNRVELAEGSFTTSLIGSRVTYTMTPMMFVSALVQYNSSSHTVSANVRMRWEYRPGSEMFLVFNEQRDTLARDVSGLTNRAIIFKINRLLRF